MLNMKGLMLCHYGTNNCIHHIRISRTQMFVHCVEADDRGIYNGHHKMADPEEGKFCFDSVS